MDRRSESGARNRRYPRRPAWAGSALRQGPAEPGRSRVPVPPTPLESETQMATTDRIARQVRTGRPRDGARRPPPDAEPHPLGPLQPVVARWPLVLVVTLLFAGVAFVAGRAQKPTYTSAASLNVGRTDVRVQALPGYVQGATSLASSYSRIAMTPQVEVPLAKELHLSRSEVARRLTAVPVPNNPFFTIQGTGRTPQDAIRFTRAATHTMQAYVTATDNGRQRLSDLLGQFRTTAAKAEAVQRRITRLKSDPSVSASSPALSKLQVEYQTAQLRASALRGEYQERSSELASTAGIQVISPAASAQSDRKKIVQRTVAVGLVAGLLVGSALALLRERAVARRRRRFA
jgi:uncharacterized protein involved in exopolysaccharide biosynthesis